jgi:anthranilate synthase/aminodeoxychorismate synthase-like glutamine amidotransferase
MILLLDNYDSFTFILKDYLQQCNQEVIVKENTDSLEEIISMDFSHVVLSPGPKTPQQSGCLMKVVEHCAVNNIPTLGVCLGHQAIGEYFGGTLKRSIKPMHGKVSPIKHLNHPLFEHIPATFNVCRYHSLIISDIDDTNLKCIATSREQEIMALAHVTLPLWGVQFHPEAILTQYGLPLLKNWLLHCN